MPGPCIFHKRIEQLDQDHHVEHALHQHAQHLSSGEEVLISGTMAAGD